MRKSVLVKINPNKYHLLQDSLKLKRSKYFVRLVKKLELGKFPNPELLIELIERYMFYEDFEFMCIEELILFRIHGFINNSEIFNLFPEEFDFLEGIPVLMWDEL